MGYRRVITGHSPEGKAVVAGDAEVEPITSDLQPGLELRKIWGGDRTPTYPDDGSAPSSDTWFPPPGGFRFIQFTLGPEAAPAPTDVDQEAAAAAFDQQAPGLLATMEPEGPGFHRSDTLDVMHIVSGTVICVLDDGVEVALSAGDTIVQSGTRHAWRNPGSEPCHMVGMIVGARRVDA